MGPSQSFMTTESPVGLEFIFCITNMPRRLEIPAPPFSVGGWVKGWVVECPDPSVLYVTLLQKAWMALCPEYPAQPRSMCLCFEHLHQWPRAATASSC
jgi:hypothetical protein